MQIADVFANPDAHHSPEQQRWLAPPGVFAELAARTGWTLNRLLLHALFRLQVEGIENLPGDGPYLLTPNHSSSLDPPLLAAALPNRVLRKTFWIARRGAVMRNFLTRKLGRWGHAIPFDRDQNGLSALAVAATLLKRGNNVVWFPEGRRATDGQLQEFKFGVGALLDRFRVPAIPIRMDGAFEALPPDRRRPRLRARLVVRFGEPFVAQCEMAEEDDTDRYQQLADNLHDVIADLAV